MLFSFAENARIQTGSGAMWFDNGFTFIAEGDLDFVYGGSDALLIEYSNWANGTTQSASAEGMAFNLIMDGVIGDNGEDNTTGTLTFRGGGWALLTGGTDFSGVDSEFALAVLSVKG